MKLRLGIVGAGKMGQPITENLYAAGFDIIIYARRQEVVQKMKEKGIKVAKTLRELGEKSDVIFDILTDSSATWEVLTTKAAILGESRKKYRPSP